jgi:hypothetical protein
VRVIVRQSTQCAARFAFWAVASFGLGLLFAWVALEIYRATR